MNLEYHEVRFTNGFNHQTLSIFDQLNSTYANYYHPPTRFNGNEGMREWGKRE